MIHIRILLLSIFCIFGMTSIHCQKVKKVKNKLFLDEDNLEISKLRFKSKINYAYNIDIVAPTDSVIYHKLYVRNRFGKIESPAHLSSLRSKISESLGVEIDFSQDVGFGYFPELAKCSQILGSHSFYLNEPRFNKYDIPYYAVLDPEAGEQVYPYPYHFDTQHVFRDFFPEAVDCELWIVLRPDGSFRTFIGEGGPAIFSYLGKWNKRFIEKAMHSKDVFPDQ